MISLVKCCCMAVWVSAFIFKNLFLITRVYFVWGHVQSPIECLAVDLSGFVLFKVDCVCRLVLKSKLESFS